LVLDKACAIYNFVLINFKRGISCPAGVLVDYSKKGSFMHYFFSFYFLFFSIVHADEIKYEAVKYKYNTKKISKDKLKGAIEHFGPYRKQIAATYLCGDPVDSNFIKTCNQAIKKAEKDLKEFKRITAYPELKDISDYIVRYVEKNVRIAKIEVDFVKTQNIDLLKKEVGYLKPEVVCKEAIVQIENSKDPKEKFSLLMNEWVRNLSIADIPFTKFPQNSWEEYLKKYDVKEQILVDCDGEGGIGCGASD
jgi:hypothetical protein